VASIFCPQTAPDHVQLECGVELGGIIAAIYIDEDIDPTLTDLSTRSYWVTKLAATPTQWWVVKDTRGTYPGGTPVEEEGYGKTPTLRTGADHEMNLEVRGVLSNRTFWAIVNQTAKWNVIFITNGNVGHYVQDVSVYAKQVIDQNIKTSERMQVNHKWSDDLSNPVVFDATPMLDLFTN
jgi:hypothetical protein